MALPSLVQYDTAAEYRKHYEMIYCQGKIVTFDGIRVYFKTDAFDHAFYESTSRDKRKNLFSFARAQRINWIRTTLEAHDAHVYQGWDKSKKRYDPGRRVCIVYEDFVVVIELRLKKSGELKGRFGTCYKADNSINKIRTSPEWTEKICRTELNKKGR